MIQKFIFIIYFVILRIYSKIHEYLLMRKIKNGTLKIPKTLSIILDGNRRYAKLMGYSYEQVYELGAQKVKDICDFCKELGIKNCVVWAVSKDNFKRPNKQMDSLLEVLGQYFDLNSGKVQMKRENFKLNFLGDLTFLPEKYQYLSSIFKHAEEETKNNSGVQLTTAICYDGREQFVDSINKILSTKNTIPNSNSNSNSSPVFLPSLRVDQGINDQMLTVQDVDDASVLKKLNIPSIDIVVRTGGNHYLSNFLSWETGRSTIFFADEGFPISSRLTFLLAISKWNYDSLQSLTSQTSNS